MSNHPYEWDQKLTDEWALHLQRVGSTHGTPRDFNRAVMWVLTVVFGYADVDAAMSKYHMDTMFHTQVNVAAQMIERLSDLTAHAREERRREMGR